MLVPGAVIGNAGQGFLVYVERREQQSSIVCLHDLLILGTLQSTNIAMENGPVVDELRILNMFKW